MKVPQPPETDEEVQRHKFYGGISSAFSCLLDKQELHDIWSRKTHDELFQKYGKLKTSIEETNQRVNKRTYQDDFEKLQDEVVELKALEVTHATAWATGKMFIIGAWLVFSVLFSWAFSMLNLQIDEYVETIELNEKVITDLQHQMENISVLAMEHKAEKKAFNDRLNNFEETQDFINKKYKDLRQQINSYDEDHTK